MRLGRHLLRGELLGNFCSPDKMGHMTSMPFSVFSTCLELGLSDGRYSSLLEIIKLEVKSQHAKDDRPETEKSGSLMALLTG